MDTLALKNYRHIIQKIISEYAAIPYSYGEIKNHVTFDVERDSYLMIAIGWHGVKRVHDCIIHVEIINGKIWIQWDGIEDGMATELLAAGIPKEKIVLGWKSPQLRKLTEFAVS